MAQIEDGGGGGHHGKHDKKKKAKKLSTRIDMTPMVDLAFLLLTFFVLTSTFSKPKVLRMIFPEEIKDQKPNNDNKVKDGITIIMSGEDKVYYYNDKLPANQPDSFHLSNYGKDGLRAALKAGNRKLLNKRLALQKKLNTIDGKDSAAINKINKELQKAVDEDRFVVIVKHDEGATYRNMIDVVDELLITQVGRYFVDDKPLSPLEKKALEQARAKNK